MALSFTNLPANFSISESTPPGTVIYDVNFTGNVGSVGLSITSGNVSGNFLIDSAGRIEVTNGSGFSAGETYNLNIQGQDSGDPGYEINATVSVQITAAPQRTDSISITHKRSSTSGNTPSASLLQRGELAINFADQKIFTKNTNDQIIALGGGAFETLTCSTNYGHNVVDSVNTYSFVNGTYGPGGNFFVGKNAGVSTNGTYGLGGCNNFIGVSAGRCNTTGYNNNFFGAYAGFLNTTGLQNNFFGRLTGFFNTTGTNNNFFGTQVGYYNTTGSNNNFIGNYAGYQNTTGSNNNFIGRDAGRCNTYGSCNNFFGACAGRCNTTGCNNNFIGTCAGHCNTSGYCNNFIGHLAGYKNTAGTRNNFIGLFAGVSNTTGNSNNFFGSYAGRCNITGSYNNFFGRYAGRSNTTGSCNNFIGCNTGVSNTTGICNNFFGTNAGSSNTTGSNNTYLGGFNGAGFATCSNHVFLADGAGNRRIEFNNSGSLGVAGANFGTAGQVLTSCGNAAAPVWADAGGGGGTFETLTCSNNYAYNVVDSNNTYSFVNGFYGPGSNFFVGLNAGINTNGTYGFGSYNNFIGRESGCSNTTGNSNNFIGNNVGRSNTTGSSNNFLGRFAGRFNTTGGNNNFFGNNTGYYNTSGINNNFMGRYAGFNNTTGSCNTFIGSFAGRYNTTGANNTYLGGFSGTGFATCSNHVFISDGAGNRRIEFNNSGSLGVAGANFGTAGQVLTSCGNAAAPVWADAGGGGISNVVEDTTPQLGGNLDLGGNYIGHANANMKAYDFSTGASFEVTMQGYTALSIYANMGSSIANVTINDDLIVQGGDITLGGTGRIQGIDTVSANTDAANKLYVDNAVAGAGGGGGTFETQTCSLNYGYNVVDCNNTYSFVNGTYGPGSNFFVGQNAGINTNGTFGLGSFNNFMGRGAGCSNTSGWNNNFFGQNTGRFNTTGGNNNFFGSNAGYCNTTGVHNNFFGCSAGCLNTTGGNNNFFGFYAGRNNTTGANNNFIGNYAGFSNTTGIQNNFFGQRAGCNNTTGGVNNFFGGYAGFCNTTGCFNNFFGSLAGCANITGGYNNFIGQHAGRCNTAGNRSNFLGKCTGCSNTTGNDNNFMGSYAGFCNTTGSYNIFFGRAAGRNNTTGSNNSFIGTNAGYYTTGSCNNFFGRQAGYSNTTGNNNTYLGGFNGTGFATCSNYVHFSDGAGIHRGMFDNIGDFHSDGDVIAYSTSVSDERLKKDISIVTGALSKIRQINGVEFTMKDDESRRAGVIAQEVEKVFPVAVTEKKLMNHETYKTVRYDALHALLIEAVKELADAVEKLSENK